MEIYLQHHGVKGQKWGVRRYQNKDGSLTAAGKKRQAIIDKERASVDESIESHNKQIEQYKSAAKKHRDRADDIRKNGIPELSDRFSKELVDTTIKNYIESNEADARRNEADALWNEHLVKHMKSYNKKLSEVDISEMSIRQVRSYVNSLSNKTINEITSTWKEPYDN